MMMFSTKLLSCATAVVVAFAPTETLCSSSTSAASASGSAFMEPGAGVMGGAAGDKDWEMAQLLVEMKDARGLEVENQDALQGKFVRFCQVIQKDVLKREAEVNRRFDIRPASYLADRTPDRVKWSVHPYRWGDDAKEKNVAARRLIELFQGRLPQLAGAELAYHAEGSPMIPAHKEQYKTQAIARGFTVTSSEIVLDLQTGLVTLLVKTDEICAPTGTGSNAWVGNFGTIRFP